MSAPVVLVLVAGAALLGAVLGYLAGRLRERRAREKTTAVDAAMGLDRLAVLVEVLAQMDPEWTRRTVNSWKDPGLLQVFLIAALSTIVADPEAVRRVRTAADEMVTAKLWDLPTADRPGPAR